MSVKNPSDHTAIIEDNGLRDDGSPLSGAFYRVEYLPHGDISVWENWTREIDGEKPEWVTDSMLADSDRKAREIFDRMDEWVVFRCNGLGITKIPVIPKLKRLYCYNNQLTKIPVMPKLKTLDCSDNQIVTIPAMPRLEWLYCHNNQIVTIPVMPKLKTLDCSDNRLTKIPVMPKLKTENIYN